MRHKKVKLSMRAFKCKCEKERVLPQGFENSKKISSCGEHGYI